MAGTDRGWRLLIVLNLALTLGVVLLGLMLALRWRGPIEDRVRSFWERERAEALAAFAHQSDEVAELPLYELTISRTGLYQVQQEVRRMTAVGILHEEDRHWLPARFVHAGKTWKVSLRLRGDLPNHWRAEKKSWRVRFDDVAGPGGVRTLDLVIPRDKYYALQPVASDLARSLGVLVPQTQFCRMRINGVDFGLYLAMEKYGAEMLERQARSVGEIFRERNVWTQTRFSGLGFDLDDFRYLGADFEPTILKGPARQQAVQRWNAFLDLIRDADDVTFRREIPRLLDVERYLTWNAVTWLFGSTHTHWGDNLRWYYDPSSGLFEPILYDVDVEPIVLPPPGPHDPPLWRFESAEYDRLALRLMRIPAYAQRRNEKLWTLVRGERSEVADRCRALNRRLRSYLLTGAGAEKASSLDARVSTTQEVVVENQRDLRRALAFSRVFASPVLAGDGRSLTLRIVPDGHAQILVERLVLEVEGAGGSPLSPTSVLELQDPQGTRSSWRPLFVRATGARTVEIGLRGMALATARDATLRLVPGEWRLRLPLRAGTAVTRVDGSFRNTVTGEPVPPAYVLMAPVGLDREDVPSPARLRTSLSLRRLPTENDGRS